MYPSVYIFFFKKKLSHAFGVETAKTELVPAFVKLLKDTEAEVRTAAASKVTGFAEIVGPELTIRDIIPCVKELVTDQSQHVRGFFLKKNKLDFSLMKEFLISYI